MSRLAASVAALALLWGGSATAGTPVMDAGAVARMVEHLSIRTVRPTIEPATYVETTPLGVSGTYVAPITYETLPAATVQYSTVPVTAYAPAPAVAEPYRPAIMELSGSHTELHELVTRPDVSTAINFQGSERISVVTMGRQDQFFVDTPANHKTISIRPKSASSRSNLTIVTNKGIYHFDVRAVASGDVHYGVVMEDRDKAEQARRNSLGDVADLNFSYTYRGADALRPLRMFDDGKHTYFQFPDHVTMPAIFAVAGDGSESIVNHHVKGRYVVVEALERQFTLRDGKTVTCIFNKAYPKTVFTDAAPTKEGS